MYPNPNVMFELGYALEQFRNNNIIYILNENYKIILLTNKKMCLSNYDNLYNDLQHLELIINYKKDF